MPLRAVLYQADLLHHGPKDDHHNLYSFFGDDGTHYDPFHFLNSQAQNCNYARGSQCSLLVPDRGNKGVLSRPSTSIDKKDRQKVFPRRRRLRGEMNEEVLRRQQRLTHIAMERNRRKQVNKYLSIIRSTMPHSYADKGDQASIVGGAINFVKELEQKLQWLEMRHKYTNSIASNNSSLPFSDFLASDPCLMLDNKMNTNNAAVAEVSVVECFANLKVRITTGPVRNQLLLRILEHLDECKLTVLHLTVSGVEEDVLYNICIKVEDESKITSGDDIAASIHELITAHQDSK